MSKISSFEDIEIWKKSVELCEKIYLLTENSSLKQDFGLRDQIRRSAISIPSNIAEGFERESNNQFIYLFSHHCKSFMWRIENSVVFSYENKTY